MKLIYSDFNKNTGISTVVLQNREGCYKGIARVHPEDDNDGNAITGCSIAESRAMIKYHKAMIKKNKTKIKALQSFLDDLIFDTSIPDIRSCNPIIRRLMIHIEYYKKENIMHQNCIDSYNMILEHRNKFREKLKEIKHKEANN